MIVHSGILLLTTGQESGLKPAQSVTQRATETEGDRYMDTSLRGEKITNNNNYNYISKLY